MNVFLPAFCFRCKTVLCWLSITVRTLRNHRCFPTSAALAQGDFFLGQHCRRRPGPQTTEMTAPTIVFVGADVIGLSTAYHLAKANTLRATEQRHRTVVVDDGKEFFLPPPLRTQASCRTLTS